MAKRKRNEQAPASPASPSGPPQPALVRLLVVLTQVGVYGGLLMPLVFHPGLTIFPYVFFKMLVFQALIAITLPAWIALAWIDPRYRPTRSWVLVAVLAHFAALGVATLLAADPHRAFWGNQERMAGFYNLAHFLAWFLMATSTVRTWPQWQRLLHWQALLGFAMAMVTLLQRPIPTLLGPEADVRLSGLLGNPIYSATYHVFILFILALLWVRVEQRSLRPLYVIGALGSLHAIQAAGSRGALLGLVVGASVTVVVWAISERRWHLVTGLAVALVAGIAAYAGVALVLLPLPALKQFWKDHQALEHIFWLDFDPTRRALWAVAWEGFKDRPLFGWGVGSYDIVFDVHYRPSFMCKGLPGTLQDSAHSLIFDTLASAGAAGLITFAAIWAAVLAALTRALRQGALQHRAGAVLFGLTAAYLVQGLFIFDNPATWSLCALLQAFAAAAAAPAFTADAPAEPAPPQPRRFALQGWLALEACAALLVFRTDWQPGYSSYLTREAHRVFQMGSCSGMLALSRESWQTPSPYLDDQLYMIARDVGTLAGRGMLNRCDAWKELTEHARLVGTELLRRHPDHSRQRAVLANLLFAVGREGRDASYLAEAGTLFQRLIAESPRRQQHRFDYANWLAEQGRAQEGRTHLEGAYKDDETIGDAGWRLGTYVWRFLGQAEAGATLMAKAQVGECGYQLRNSLELQQLSQAYAAIGDREGMRSAARRFDELAREDRPTVVLVAIARFLERFGLIEERNSMLLAGSLRDPALAKWLEPLRMGQAQTMEQADAIAAAAGRPPLPRQ